MPRKPLTPSPEDQIPKWASLLTAALEKMEKRIAKLEQTTLPPREYCTVGEVANRYEVSEKVVLAWIKKKVIPATRIGVTTRIKVADLP